MIEFAQVVQNELNKTTKIISSCLNVLNVQSKILVSRPSLRSWAVRLAASREGNRISLKGLVRKYGKINVTLAISIIQEFI
jgi:hypothetical protein